jgi:hypothetical protein
MLIRCRKLTGMFVRISRPCPGLVTKFPHPFAVGGNRSYLEFWAITGDPRYPGYLTPTKEVDFIANLIVLESKGIDIIYGMDWLGKHKV